MCLQRSLTSIDVCILTVRTEARGMVRGVLAMPVYVEDIRESLNLALPGYVENIY